MSDAIKHLRLLQKHIKLLEKQNKFMTQALRDIRDHDEDESWTYEILQFIAAEALKYNRETHEMDEVEYIPDIFNSIESPDEWGPVGSPKSDIIKRLIRTRRF